MNTRLLGSLCIIGSLIAIADGVRNVIIGHQSVAGVRHFDTISSTADIVWMLGVLCAVLGLIALKATGTNPIFRFLTYVPAAGAVVQIVAFLLQLTGVPSEKNWVLGLGTFLLLGGMLVVGILTLAARTWLGWRRFTPLLIILSLPLVVLVVGVTGLDGWFNIINGAAYLLLGYAVQSSEPVMHLRDATMS